MTATPRFPGRALASLALVVGAWGSLAALDVVIGAVQRRAEAQAGGHAEAEVPGPPERDAAAAPGPAAGRVFVLLVDSLRAETAETLPSLRALRASGLFVHVSSTQDAATVPSVRAAFTGETQRSMFVFVRNFVHGGDALPSLFTQLAARGDAAAVFSDGTFHEMAADIAAIRHNELPPAADAPGTDEQTRQLDAFAQALSVYEREPYALVLFHLTIADHAAHAFGVSDPRYQNTFRVVDELVRRASASVRPGDTLLVMGDHGHDPAGRHFPGMKVPTVGYYRGPGFRAGVEIGPLPMTIHRYLLSWALGLPLTPRYHGAGAAHALAGQGPIPAAFVSPPPEASAVPRWRARLLLMVPLLVAIALAAAAGAWWLAARARRLCRARLARLALTALVVAAGFVAWGVFLFHRRLASAPWGPTVTFRVWLTVLVVACALVATGRIRRMPVTWVVLALPALLLYPSSDYGGWAAGMGQAWSIALAVLVADWVRRLVASWRDVEARRALVAQSWAIGGVALLALFVMPYFYVEAEGLVFGGWRGYLTSDRIVHWIVVCTTANVVLFVRPGRGLAFNLVAFAMVDLVVAVSFDAIAHTPKARLLLAALVGAAAVAARAFPRTRGSAATLTNAALLLAFRATVVLDDRAFFQLQLLLAALTLSARVSAVLGREEDRASFASWLQAIALLIATWTTLALSLQRLEWHILYEFFSPPFVENHVGWFLPIIVGRYAIPLVIARRLLAERGGAADGPVSAWHASFGAASAKLVTLLLMTAGYAIVDPTGEIFLEAVQNVLAFSAPLLALAYEPRRISASP